MEVQKQVRLNSEKKIENSIFKLKVGTVNKTNPEAIYFEGGTFITPRAEKVSYEAEMSEIKYNLKQSISKNLKNNVYFADKYILDFKIAINGIKPEKKSFLSFQLLVKQKKGHILKLKELHLGADKFINEIAFNLSDDIRAHDFLLYKKKK